MPHQVSKLLSSFSLAHLQWQLRLLQEAGEEVRQSYCWLARPLLVACFGPHAPGSVQPLRHYFAYV